MNGSLLPAAATPDSRPGPGASIVRTSLLFLPRSCFPEPLLTGVVFETQDSWELSSLPSFSACCPVLLLTQTPIDMRPPPHTCTHTHTCAPTHPPTHTPTPPHPTPPRVLPSWAPKRATHMHAGITISRINHMILTHQPYDTHMKMNTATTNDTAVHAACARIQQTAPWGGPGADVYAMCLSSPGAHTATLWDASRLLHKKATRPS